MASERTSCRITVRIQPRSSRNRIARCPDGSYKIWLTAPPVEGAANEALVKFVASLLKTAKSRVEIVSGATSRNKIIQIDGTSALNLAALNLDAE